MKFWVWFAGKIENREHNDSLFETEPQNNIVGKVVFLKCGHLTIIMLLIVRPRFKATL